MAIKYILPCLLLILFASCTTDGRLYTNKVIPYSDEFERTPIGSKRCFITDFKVKEPVSGYNISAEWMTSSVYEKVLEAGITKVYYADLKIFSILQGVYSKKTLIVYGD